MNKIIKSASFLFALLTMLFQPIQLTQNTENCCAACAMKKEEDEIVSRVLTYLLLRNLWVLFSSKCG